MPLRTPIIVLAVLLLAVGCKRSSTPGTPATVALGTGSVSIGHSAAWYVMGQDSVPVIVFVDNAGNTTGSADNDRVRGTVISAAGKSIAIDYTAGDGVSIDGVQYDLSKGAVFLVYSKESPMRIVQLQRKPLPLSGSNQVTVAMDLSRDDPDVRRFVEAANAPASATTRSDR